VHAVIGGFHLAPYMENYVRQTIAALKEMDIDYVVPLHCSGEEFYELAKAEMPTKLLRSYTGTRFVFEGIGCLACVTPWSADVRNRPMTALGQRQTCAPTSTGVRLVPHSGRPAPGR
jgi:hypothetical protein